MDYYSYLLKTSWPAVSGLLVVYALFLVRMGFSLGKLRSDKSALLKVKITGRAIITAAVLLIYSNMFIINNNDWFKAPSESKGTVESITRRSGSEGETYWMRLNGGEKSITVKVDQYLAERLKVKDTVQINYLSVKNEVYQCTVLDRET